MLSDTTNKVLLAPSVQHLGARRSKFVSGVLKFALARRLSIQTLNFASDAFKFALARRLPTQMHFGTAGNTQNLGARRSKCVSGALKYALARRLSIQTHFRYSQMRSRSTPVDPNARELMWQTNI